MKIQIIPAIAIAILLLPLATNAQKKPSKFQLEMNYGLNGNFFVINYPDYSPTPFKRFYKKNFIGTIAGIESRYTIGKRTNIGLGFSKSNNKKEITYDNGNNVSFQNFNINHTNYFYTLDIEHNLFKNINNVALQIGLFYLRVKQQEIDISPFAMGAEERSFKNGKLEEGGAYIGLHYFKKIDTKFDFGIKARVYYTISTASMEAITLTPTLRFHF